MNIFQKLFRGNDTKKELGMPLPSWSFVNGLFVPYGANNEAYIESYKRTAFIYSLISWLVEKAATVPIEAYEVTNESKYRRYQGQIKSLRGSKGLTTALITKQQALEQIEDHPVIQLLNNPSPNFSGKELMEQIYGYYLLTGNAYLYIATPGLGLNRDIPKELWNIPSPTVEIVAGDRMNLVAGYKVSYSSETIDPERIIHLKSFNPVTNLDNPAEMLYGLSPLRSLRTQVTTLDHSDTAQGTLFRNMAPVGILKGNSSDDPRQRLTQEQVGQIGNQFRSRHTGSIKGGGIVVTPADVSWERIGLSPVDMNILEGKRSLKEDICNAYHVPVTLFANDGGGLTSQGGAMEEAMKQAISDAIIPLVNRYVDALNNSLAPRYGDNIVLQADFSVFDALQEDLKEAAEWLNASWDITPNERRKFKGFDTLPDPNMDKIYIPSGLSPLDQANGEVPDIDIDPDELPE